MQKRGGIWYLEKWGSQKILLGSRNLESVFDKSQSLIFAWFVFTFFQVLKLFSKESRAQIFNYSRVSVSWQVSDFTINFATPKKSVWHVKPVS